jgi:hypothetical protein
MTIKLLRSVLLIGFLSLLGACSEEPEVKNDSAGHGHTHD